MTLFLTILMIILICEGIDRTEVTVRCCMADCKNITTWTITYWLAACFFTASWYPYVCKEHWELFCATAEEDEVKIVEKVEKE